MAAGRLPFPGTEYGPCSTPCEHKDCKATEQMSEMKCSYCEKPIGYETRFYQTSNHGEPMKLVHATCHEEAIEKERAAS